MTRPKHIDRLMERLDPVDEASLDFYMADLEGQIKHLAPRQSQTSDDQGETSIKVVIHDHKQTAAVCVYAAGDFLMGAKGVKTTTRDNTYEEVLYYAALEIERLQRQLDTTQGRATPVRTATDIRQLALSCGFKLKEQPSGIMDLNPYVYEFAQALLAQHNASGVIQRGIDHGHY